MPQEKLQTVDDRMLAMYEGSPLMVATQFEFVGPLHLSGKYARPYLPVRRDLAKLVDSGDPYWFINSWLTSVPRVEIERMMLGAGQRPGIPELIWRGSRKRLLAGKPFHKETKPVLMPRYYGLRYDMQPDRRHFFPTESPDDGINLLLAHTLITRADSQHEVQSSQRLKQLAAINGLSVDFSALRRGAVRLVSQDMIERLWAAGALTPDTLPVFGSEAAYWMAMCALEYSFDKNRVRGEDRIFPYPFKMIKDDPGFAPHLYMLPSVGVATILYLSQVPNYLSRGEVYPITNVHTATAQWFEFARRSLLRHAQHQLGIDLQVVREAVQGAGVNIDLSARAGGIRSQLARFYEEPVKQVLAYIRQRRGDEVAREWLQVAQTCESLFDRFMDVLQAYGGDPGAWNKLPGRPGEGPGVLTTGEWMNYLRKSGADTAHSGHSFRWSLIRGVRGRK